MEEDVDWDGGMPRWFDKRRLDDLVALIHQRPVQAIDEARTETQTEDRTPMASVDDAALHARVSQLREDDRTPMASMFDAAPHRRVS